MMEYHAAYRRDPESGWYIAEVLDFPGALSQGKTLNSARRMIRDALRCMAEWHLEEGEPLPSPDPNSRDNTAEFQEVLRLQIRIQSGVRA
jgi:predicted RNase H-like HicB family nuclease